MPVSLRRFGPWIAFAIACAAYYPRFIKDPIGMMLYPEGAACLLQSAPLRQCSESFTYPPVFAFLMSPFVPLSMPVRNVIWYLLLIGAIAGSFVISGHLALALDRRRWTERELAWLRILTFVLSLKFVLAILEFQAYDALAMVLIAGGMLMLLAGRDLGSGALLAVAAAIKATPLIFLPYLILKRRFAGAALFLAVFVFLWFLPDLYLWLVKGATPGYLQTWIRQIAAPALTNDPGRPDAWYWSLWLGANSSNFSLRGAVTRLAYGTSLMPHIELMLYAASALYAALIGATLLKNAQRDERMAIDASVLLIGMLMFSPMTSRYHYIVLILPHATVVALTLSHRSIAPAGIATLVLSFVLLTATANDLAGRALTEWSNAHDFLVLGATVLLLFLLYASIRLDRIAGTAADPARSRAGEAAA